VPAIDAALGGLITGDNVVWIVDDPPLYSALARSFVATTRSPEEWILYVDFGGGTIPDGDDIERIDGTARSATARPAPLADEIERRVQHGRPASIVIDQLGRTGRRWKQGEAGRFFERICPAMLQAGVTAYWGLDSSLGRAMVEDVRQITQCMIDVRGGRLRVVKAEGRPRALEGLTHRMELGADKRVVVSPGPAGGRLARGLIALREQLGLTQQELAGLAEVTPSAISQAEAGSRGLSLDTVVSIADRLELPVDRVLGRAASRGYVLARHDRSRRIANDTVAALAADTTLGVRAFLLTLGGLESATPPLEHRGLMLFMPLNGVMQVDLDEDRPVLRAGDVLIVETGAAHAWRNLGRDPLSCCWVLRD
jgi:transcriptional regulator with XRE-family HTH domain